MKPYQVRKWELQKKQILTYTEWLNLWEWDESGEIVKNSKGELVTDKFEKDFAKIQAETVEELVFDMKDQFPKLDFDFGFWAGEQKKWCFRIDTTAYWGTREKTENFFVKLTARNRKKGA